MVKRVNTAMLPETPFYGSYDHAVADWVHGNVKWSGKPVTCVFATPERAFAEVWKRINPNKDPQVETQKTYPLPFVSISRIGPGEPDMARDTPAPFRRFVSTPDSKYPEHRVQWTMPWPQPRVLLYQIDFWTRNLYDLDDLVDSQLYDLFQPGYRCYWTVDHPFPMGQKLVHVKLLEDKALPVVESPDRQRVMRRAITLKVDGWKVRKPIPAKPVERVLVDIKQGVDPDHVINPLAEVQVTGE